MAESDIDWGEALQSREGVTDQKEQNRLANIEHRAYARERVKENPANAVGLSVAIPGYYVGKKTGILKGRSEATIDQMIAGYKGLTEGLSGQPWEQSWNERVVQPLQKVEEVYNEFKQALPWNRDWNKAKKEVVDVVNNLPPKQPERSTPMDFDTVFDKLILTESGGKHLDEKGNLVTSKVGAQGITQLMQKTAKKPGYGINPVKDSSEEEYRRVGKEYLQALHKKFDGDWEKTLAAYNWGVGKVSTAISKAERFGEDWKEQLPTETKKYLDKILGKKEG